MFTPSLCNLVIGTTEKRKLLAWSKKSLAYSFCHFFFKLTYEVRKLYVDTFIAQKVMETHKVSSCLLFAFASEGTHNADSIIESKIFYYLKQCGFIV